MLMQNDQNAIGRLRVLTLIAHWYGKTKNWGMIRSMFESILEEVEMGEKDWLDDFSGYEMMLPSMTMINVESSGPKMGNKKYEVYWCKTYQNASCELTAPHMAQIKPDKPMVPVLHICAYCWTNYRKRKEHSENDCTAKK